LPLDFWEDEHFIKQKIPEEINVLDYSMLSARRNRLKPIKLMEAFVPSPEQKTSLAH